MKVNIINEGAKFGLICGLIAVLLMFGSWAASDATFASVQKYSNFIPYMFVIILYGTFNVRKQNNNYLSFAEGIKFCFLAFALSTLILGIGNYILFNLIDRGLSERIAVIAIEDIRNMMEKFGATEKDIEKSIASSGESLKDTGFKKIFLGVGFSLIIGFIEAAIISAIAKKEQKFEDQ
ncbi:MAG: DUF4199 domain-containing protein [Sediminibacterium sp.]